MHRFLRSRKWSAKKGRSSLILPHLKLCICSFVKLLFNETVTIVDVEWTAHEEANYEDARDVLCVLGDF